MIVQITLVTHYTSRYIIENLSDLRIFQHSGLPQLYQIGYQFWIELLLIQCIPNILAEYLFHAKACLDMYMSNVINAKQEPVNVLAAQACISNLIIEAMIKVLSNKTIAKLN